jgi:hypothetical protein
MVLGHEPRCFYLDRDYLLGNHAEVFSTRDLASSDGLLEALDRMGVTHLLLHPTTQEDMVARSGALETRLAELATAQEILLTGTIDSLTLWEVADARSESAP